MTEKHAVFEKRLKRAQLVAGQQSVSWHSNPSHEKEVLGATNGRVSFGHGNSSTIVLLSEKNVNRQSLMQLVAAIAKHEEREQVVARKRKQEETETARRQEEEAVISALRVELRALRETAPGMSLPTAVEFTTSDPARRIALYRLCTAEDRSVRSSGLDQDDPNLLKIASSIAKELASLERRARAEGFQI
jgi:hypothetical protein